MSWFQSIFKLTFPFSRAKSAYSDDVYRDPGGLGKDRSRLTPLQANPWYSHIRINRITVLQDKRICPKILDVLKERVFYHPYSKFKLAIYGSVI